MSLAETIEEIAKSKVKIQKECAWMFLYNSLPKDDAKAVDDALAKNYPVSLIIRALRAEGYKTSSDAIRAHLHKACKCPKD